MFTIAICLQSISSFLQTAYALCFIGTEHNESVTKSSTSKKNNIGIQLEYFTTSNNQSLQTSLTEKQHWGFHDFTITKDSNTTREY